MKKIHILISLLVLIFLQAFVLINQKADPVIKDSFKVAELQYRKMLEVSTDLSKYPRGDAKDGSLRYTKIGDWTGGFWPGALWYLYEYTGKQEWRDAAEKWTASLESNQYNANHHDIGFMMYCSYGNGYRLTKNESYKPILIQSANTLLKRYSPKVGSIMSWNPKKANWATNRWDFPVIIDNMMNLELLFFASEVTGDDKYKKAALKHAETTMKNHIRPDFSAYHVVSYDSVSGAVKYRQTAQGFSDNSAWSRGQAWGIYGFTATYRETKDKRFLNTAIGMADYFLDNKTLPADKIPLWDFNVGQPGFNPTWNFDSANKEIPRDASAAAIASSALLELSKYVDKAKAKKYQSAAVQIIHSLGSPAYLAQPGSNNYFLLKHSVGSFPAASEVNSPLIYADYYFLEALLRYNKTLKQ